MMNFWKNEFNPNYFTYKIKTITYKFQEQFLYFNFIIIYLFLFILKK